MEYLYVMVLMFLSIFGMVMLIRLFFGALLSSALRRFDVYVKADEDTGEFVRRARRSDLIGDIYLMTDGDDDSARKLAEEYPDVKIVGKTGR